MDEEQMRNIELREVYVKGLVRTICGQASIIGELMKEIEKLKKELQSKERG